MYLRIVSRVNMQKSDHCAGNMTIAIGSNILKLIKPKKDVETCKSR